MTGVLVMLIGITFVTVGCDQANKAGGNGGNNTGNVTNSNNQNNNSNNEITGVWKVSKMGSQTFPQDPSGGTIQGAQAQMYVCLTADGKIISAIEKKGLPSGNGLSNGPIAGTYKLLPGNKAEIDFNDGHGSNTISYTINGDILTIDDLQLEASKTTTLTETQIKDALQPEIPGNDEIAGVWKVLKLGSTTFPTPMTAAPGGPGVPAEAKQQLYLCLTTDKKVIQVVEITGFPQANGFSKNPTEGAYKLLSGNKVEIDLGDGADTVSYTISGINLKLIEVQIEAVKVTSPTEADIKALP